MHKTLSLNGRLLSNIVKQLVIKAPLALLAVVLLTGLSCGKRRAPLPPRERVPQRVELEAFQRGNRVVLSWRMPARNAPKGSVLNISRADVYRLAEPLSSPLTLSEEEFESRSLMITSIPITDADFGLKTISFTDTLEFSNQPARLRYAVRLVNASGQKAGFSNFVLLEPASSIAANATNLSATVTQDAINLTWEAPKTNVDLSTPPNIIGYNVYRSTSEKESATLLNPTPVSKKNWSDEFFEFGKPYFYFVRVVSVGTGGKPVESTESNVLKVNPIDSFPPSPPAGITLATSPTSISIFFAVSPEKDIAGYKIYRSTDPNLPKSEWTSLTPELYKANTYQDTRVESGKKYYYYLTATDATGNISGPSEVVSETVQ